MSSEKETGCPECVNPEAVEVCIGPCDVERDRQERQQASLMYHRQRCVEIAHAVVGITDRAVKVVRVAKRLMRFVEEGR
jgi:hypothetical protein